MTHDIPAALSALKAAMKDDAHYAWSWHCAIAVCAQDEGVSHDVSQRIAARAMKLAFEVDTSRPPETGQSTEVETAADAAGG